MENSKIINLSLLFVEDDSFVRESYEAILQPKLKRIICASSGEQALELFKKEKPDIILTDIVMNGMNGLELIKQIRLLNKRIPIIIASAYNNSDYLLQAIDYGINHFLLKPINFEQLFNILNNYLIIFHEEKKSKEKVQLLSEYKNAIDSSAILSKTDIDGNIIYLNNKLEKITGYKKEELLGKHFINVLSNLTSEKNIKEIQRALQRKEKWNGIVNLKTIDNDPFFVNLIIIPLYNLNSEIFEFIEIMYEINDLLKKDKLSKDLTIDILTGLPNKTRLKNDVNKADNPILMILSIDNLKDIIDFFGKEFGDAVIFEVGNRLKFLMTDEKYFLYRINTDEYAILIDKKIDIKELEIIAFYFSEWLSNDLFKYDKDEIYISVTIGIAVWDENNELASNKLNYLLSKADLSLKNARIRGRSYVIYDQSLEKSAKFKENIEWTKKIKNAIMDNRIKTFYQPIMNNHTKKIEKYECLCRLIDIDNKVISPYYFLELSKKSKLYHYITRTIVQTSFDYFIDKDFEFSLNISVEDILNKETNAFILNKLSENKDICHRVVFELLESEGIENYNEVKEFIQNVKKFGAKIAIDDFGTGYSNFDHILKLEVDYIKIDASLTKNINIDKKSRIITTIITTFAKELGLKTISEFVHCQEVFDIIASIGVDYSQGYFIGEPKSYI